MKGKTYTYKNKIISVYLLIGWGLIACSCSTGPEEKPGPASEAYRQAVSDFYLGLAAIQSDQAIFAVQKMQEVAEQYPREAAVWANLAVFSVRLGNFELATEHIQKALDLVPDNADIHFLAGILESRRGNMEQALEYMKTAAELNPSNPQILYALADELERQDSETNREEITRLFRSILEKEPDNLAVLLEMVRTSAKWEDRELLNTAMQALKQESEHWPDPTRNNLRDLEQKIEEEQIDNITFELAYLRNSLNELPEFQYDLNQVQLPPNQIGFLITGFYWLPQPATAVEPADTEMSFTGHQLADQTYDLVLPVSLIDGETDRWLGLKEGEIYLENQRIGSFPAASSDDIYTPAHISTLDYNYDFRNDLALAGSGGFALYEMQVDTTFTNITSNLQLPPSVINGSYRGVWSCDIDSDGDLDIVLSPVSGAMNVLRNNGDGTFAPWDIFSHIPSSVQFLWADFDGDGDSDPFFLAIDGSISLLRNERSGVFIADTTFPSQGNAVDMEIADIDSDGTFDLIAWSDEGILKHSFSQSTQEWTTDTVISLTEASELLSPGQGILHIADLDNNGAGDLLVSGPEGSRFWLSDDSLSFSGEMQVLETSVTGFADLNDDSRLDGIGLIDSRPAALINASENGYQARIIRPEASGPLGDRRINSFGIGGELEARSGLLYQKLPISRPWVHVGLGNYEEADMLRIIWPNGSTQAEFAELGYGSRIMNEQMLKGSCPWVFTYNGEEMEFVTDFLWRTALGLKINAQGDASAIHSIDWIKIEGDQLQPKDGYYEVRITADLWETHFFDQVSLMVVDHPEDTEVMVDERFVLPAPEHKLYPVAPLRPVEKALDQDRNDVTQVVKEKDGTYVDSFELTAYQGLAEEHYVEIHLGEDLPRDEPVYLVTHGWVYPTDTSINVAISQTGMSPPHGISVQVPDGSGGWKTVRDDIGFPAGKTKTVMIDLSDLTPGTVPDKVRLSTNMEIYWDQIAWAVGRPDTEIQTRELTADLAELRYRGYSKVGRESRLAPEMPDYGVIAGTVPKWIDLIGHYTRFGDVRELVEEIDDRYVIMNAGDELVFRFSAPAPPPEGWRRDFVLIGDGWVKDGDYNTGFSKTVLPLPYHGLEDYSKAPGRLEDDPVYQKHPEDWVDYHTRYVTPHTFRTALRFED